MYESYWQLRYKPFENNADSQFYFPGESHQAALLKLRYAVENRRGAALLAGTAGTGKTLVAAMLQAALGEEVSPFIRLVYPQMSPAELIAYVADELDGLPGGSSVPESVRRIERSLAENVEQGRHAVLLVDEAHLLDDGPMLETLRLLLNFCPNGQSGMTLLLAGQTGILPILDRTPQLEERLGVKCLLRPFTAQETGEYVAHRLRTAGALQPIVEPEAIGVLFELTHGIARQINRLCDLALLVGFADEQRSITANHFEAVSRELLEVAPE